MPLSEKHRSELIAVASLMLGLFLLLTLLPVNVTGPVGRLVGGALRAGFGLGAAFIPLAGIAAGLAGLGWIKGIGVKRLAIFTSGLILLVPYAIAVAAGTEVSAAQEEWNLAQQLAGLVPVLMVVGIEAVIGTAGAAIVGLLGLSALTMVTFDWNPFRKEQGRGKREKGKAEGAVFTAGREEGDRAPEREEEEYVPPYRRAALPPHKSKKKLSPAEPSPYELPSLDLLDQPEGDGKGGSEAEFDRLGQVLIDTLATFRVGGKITGRVTGPVVTRFEVAPDPGVKVGRIAALADDLALAMRAQSIRIVAPIPGKAAVGIEVPNPSARMVLIREMLESNAWLESRKTLPIVLGEDLEGRPIVDDLAKMPHLLIAGATGSGKSVCINTIITSLVYAHPPEELRFLMIDPKMVELSIYQALPHLRHPVVTNNHKAATVFKWAVKEMERRYALFSANGARNIGDFNRKVRDGKDLVLPGEEGKGKREMYGDEQSELPLAVPYTEGTLPYVVVFVDELADLMMTVQSEVEKPLAILAQKARATGIHIILATQRPSVNVITGLIKANFPCRIAFRVSAKVDSRTILDQNGAEALLGNGDMLFLPPGKSEPVRIQGAYISTEETERIMDWFKNRPVVERAESDILEQMAAIEAEEAAAEGGGPQEGGGERDPLFREAAELCIQHQLGSTSLLQRKMRIGYGRAARIIDQLHDAGILGPPDGSKPREVLIGMGQLDEYSS